MGMMCCGLIHAPQGVLLLQKDSSYFYWRNEKCERNHPAQQNSEGAKAARQQSKSDPLYAELLDVFPLAAEFVASHRFGFFLFLFISRDAPRCRSPPYLFFAFKNSDMEEVIMPKRDQYHPDYTKLYPGIHISAEVMLTLRKSDRKMEYWERDIKEGRFVQSQNQQVSEFIPGKEDSLERLAETKHQQFPERQASLESLIIRQDMIERLRSCLERLGDEDLKLVHALYFEGLSERQYARRSGIPQKTINSRKQKLLRWLRKNLS